MKSRFLKIAAPAAVLAVALPAAVVFAQSQTQPPAAQPRGPSPEMRASLLDGRIAMIKASLKLTPEQLKLWEPVEAKMRTNFTSRQQAREERRQKWTEFRGKSREERRADRPALPDRLDRASQRLTEQAAQMKDYAEALRPLYASLSEEQKAVANVVLGRQGRHHGRSFAGRW